MKNQLKIVVGLIAMTLLLFNLSDTAWAAEGKRAGKPLLTHQDREGPTSYLKIERVSIAKKSLENVTTTAGIRYVITDNTIIIGMDGHQVSTREMLVPCDAEISFETEQGQRKAIYIKMTRLGKNASRSWVSKKAD